MTVPEIAFWGDSITAGNNNNTSIPDQVGQILGITTYNRGYAGQTSTQILGHMQQEPGLWRKPSVIWVGHNNSLQPDDVLRDVAAMVALLNHDNYRVLGNLNGFDNGVTSWHYLNATKLVNDGLARVYGPRYLDVRAFFVEQYNPSLPMDVTAHSQGLPPASMVRDGLHPTDTANSVLAAWFCKQLQFRLY